MFRIEHGFAQIAISRCVGNNCHSQNTAEVKPSRVARLLDRTLEKRATVTGLADGSDVTASFLQVVLSQVTSQDSGAYYCLIIYFIPSSPGIAIMTDRKKFTACSKYTVIS